MLDAFWTGILPSPLNGGQTQEGDVDEHNKSKGCILAEIEKGETEFAIGPSKIIQ